MARAVQRIAARRDFIIHYIYLAENAGFDTAQRFRGAVETTYAGLAESPGMGAPPQGSPGKTRRSSYLRVRIAYPRTGGVAIERLVHAKQDYQRVLK